MDWRDKKIKSLKDANEEKDEKILELTKALKCSTSATASKTAQVIAAVKNENLAQSVRVFTQRKFWRFCKFIANPKHLVQATIKVLELMQPAGYEGAPNKDDPAFVAAQAEFVEL